MVNDLISNPMNSADEGCNHIIEMSNELSKLWGISYGEFWMGGNVARNQYDYILYFLDCCSPLLSSPRQKNTQMDILD